MIFINLMNQIRRGDDRAAHLLDFRSAMPSESLRTCTHLPQVGNALTYRTLRPGILVVILFNYFAIV